MSLNRLLKESAEFALRGSNVQSQFDLANDLWAVDADEGQIGQVIHNLVLNAQQAMPNGGVVTVKARNLELTQDEAILQAGKYVKITVSDQGIGIAEETLLRVFDPYFTTKEKGSGLGLASVYAIIKNHAGHVEVESRVGEGTFLSHLFASLGPSDSG